MHRLRKPAARNFHQLASLRVEMLARNSQRHADADFRRKIGLGVLQCRVIGIVGSQGPLSLRELCVGTDIEKTYASRLVAKLTDLGILKKSADTLDQRSFAIDLTKAGRQTYDRIYRIALQRNESWLAALSPEQRETFFGCLDTLEQASRTLAARLRPEAGRSRGASSNSRNHSAGSVGQGHKPSATISTRRKVASARAWPAPATEQ